MRSTPVTLLALLAIASCQRNPPAASEATLALREPVIVPLAVPPLPVVRARVDGHADLTILLDSGATLSSISAKRAAELGLATHPYSHASSTSGADGRSVAFDHFVKIGRIEIGAFSISDLILPVFDNAALDAGDLFGLLGMDVLQRLPWIVDVEREAIHFLPAAFDQDAITRYLGEADLGPGKWAVAPIGSAEKPAFHIDVGGLPEGAELRLDTGSTHTVLPAAVLAALHLEPTGTYHSRSVAGDYEGRTFHLAEFGLYGLHIECDVHEGKVDPYGLLGMNILGELVVVIDGPGKKVWMHHRRSRGRRRPGGRGRMRAIRNPAGGRPGVG